MPSHFFFVYLLDIDHRERKKAAIFFHQLTLPTQNKKGKGPQSHTFHTSI